MTRSLLAVLLMMSASAAYADDTCQTQAAEKKLHGAALNSFTKKCEKDAATVTCTQQADDKKLYGAAKASFTKKCVKDTTAAK